MGKEDSFVTTSSTPTAKYPDSCWHCIDVAKLDLACEIDAAWTFSYQIGEEEFCYTCKATLLRDTFVRKRVPIKRSRGQKPQYSFLGEWKCGRLYRETRDSRVLLLVLSAQGEFESCSEETAEGNSERCCVRVPEKLLLLAGNRRARWCFRCQAQGMEFCFHCAALRLLHALEDAGVEYEEGGYTLYVDWLRGELYASAERYDHERLLKLVQGD